MWRELEMPTKSSVTFSQCLPAPSGDARFVRVVALLNFGVKQSELAIGPSRLKWTEELRK
jgi:hypothetical protein